MSAATSDPLHLIKLLELIKNQPHLDLVRLERQVNLICGPDIWPIFRNYVGFDGSEDEFLISVRNEHPGMFTFNFVADLLMELPRTDHMMTHNLHAVYKPIVGNPGGIYVMIGGKTSIPHLIFSNQEGRICCQGTCSDPTEIGRTCQGFSFDQLITVWKETATIPDPRFYKPDVVWALFRYMLREACETREFKADIGTEWRSILNAKFILCVVRGELAKVQNIIDEIDPNLIPRAVELSLFGLHTEIFNLLVPRLRSPLDLTQIFLSPNVRNVPFMLGLVSSSAGAGVITLDYTTIFDWIRTIDRKEDINYYLRFFIEKIRQQTGGFDYPTYLKRVSNFPNSHVLRVLTEIRDENEIPI